MRDAMCRIACQGQRHRQELEAGLLADAADAEPSNAIRSRSERDTYRC